MSELPIDSIIPELKEALTAHSNAVLTAQPGAGKTTRVPLALLNESWLTPGRILMLEPRRLAARTAAHRMAGNLGEHIGETVGYRIRFDSRVGPLTRIEVVTEGILTRILQHDPFLTGYGLIIFDEFHERSLHADLGLALCLESQKALREDLRILVMSATIDTGKIADLLGHAPNLQGHGQSFHVETHFLHTPHPNLNEQTVIESVKNALSNQNGNILIFLPGTPEIRRVEQKLRSLDLGPTIQITPLYGNLSQHDQDQAIEPPPAGHRKIVLATNIAETSLTIKGIRVVIDAGFVRVSRFSPNTGMSRLETIRVSKDSADQRRGRAGRTEPGVCYRLWTTSEHQALLQRTIPEMLEADLSPLVLELALWGTANPHELSWIDPPPKSAVSNAKDLLMRLGAIDTQEQITSHGKEMAGLPLHPRLAHMVLKAKSMGLEGLACEISVLLSERDFLKARPGDRNMDIRVRLDILRQPKNLMKDFAVDRPALQRILITADQLKRQIQMPSGKPHPIQVDSRKVGLLLAFAYPDRIAQSQNRAESRYRLANGRGAFFSEPQSLANEEYLVIAHLEGGRQWARIHLAAPVYLEDLEDHFADQIRKVQLVSWNRHPGEVVAKHQRRLGELILAEQPIQDPDPKQVTKTLLEGLRQEDIDCLPWTKELRNWQARVELMGRINDKDSDWPDVSDQHLRQTLEKWLGPYVGGLTRLTQVQKIDLRKILYALLSWKQQQELDQQVPTHLTVPTGSRIPLQYDKYESPVLAVRLQEMFGQTESPRIGRGKVPVTIHLLSPARRPVQVTQDLSSFWRNSYPNVKKELKGRYPKHYWPDDPLEAEPTRRSKPRKEREHT